jgi:Dock homology region 2
VCYSSHHSLLLHSPSTDYYSCKHGCTTAAAAARLLPQHKQAHGTTGEQCKKLTELKVVDAFPCCTTRQKVHARDVKFLSPIECSLDDILTRIRVMKEEVNAGIDRRKRNTQNLMQLVQGSVLPQVQR